MCLILFAYKIHPSYNLIVAANRDEFYERPSSPAEFWEDAPQVLAGRDLKEGGAWLGITREGKFAAITNYRDPAAIKADAPSRGKLVSNFLIGPENAISYLKKISGQAHRYNGFNLIFGDDRDIFAYSNRGEKQKLEAGIYGLSNRLLDNAWPKVVRGKKALSAVMAKKGDDLEAALFTILSDKKIAPDNKLPATGIGLEWERLLSAIFICETPIPKAKRNGIGKLNNPAKRRVQCSKACFPKQALELPVGESPNYGTRSSTVLLIGKNKRVRFVEKVFDGKREPWVESRFSFVIDKGN
jgi:uncharacterized protein with NRDE domain